MAAGSMTGGPDPTTETAVAAASLGGGGLGLRPLGSHRLSSLSPSSSSILATRGHRAADPLVVDPAMADPLAAGDGNDCSEFEWWREVAEGWIHRPRIRPWLIHRRQWLSSNDGDGDSGRQLLGLGLGFWDFRIFIFTYFSFQVRTA